MQVVINLKETNCKSWKDTWTLQLKLAKNLKIYFLGCLLLSKLILVTSRWGAKNRTILSWKS